MWVRFCNWCSFKSIVWDYSCITIILIAIVNELYDCWRNGMEFVQRNVRNDERSAERTAGSHIEATVFQCESWVASRNIEHSVINCHTLDSVDGFNGDVQFNVWRTESLLQFFYRIAEWSDNRQRSHWITLLHRINHITDYCICFIRIHAISSIICAMV